jgi:hypothetical protein
VESWTLIGVRLFLWGVVLGLDREVGVCTWYIGVDLYQVHVSVFGSGTMRFCTRYRTGVLYQVHSTSGGGGAWLDWVDLSQRIMANKSTTGFH